MCGRYVLFGPESRLLEEFSIKELPPFTGRYNIAPTTDILVVLRGREGNRIARMMRWGLIPSWAKDPSIGARLNNARGETVAEKPSFRNAFKRWRCLIPANGFYEWQTIESPTGAGRPRKQPYYFAPADPRGLFAMAGLMERWNAPDGPIYSTCIITTGPNAVMEPVHDRMPVLLEPGQFDAWLDPANQDLAALQAFIRPCPADQMVSRPVSTQVSNARNEGPALIEPLPPTEPIDAE